MRSLVKSFFFIVLTQLLFLSVFGMKKKEGQRSIRYECLKVLKGHLGSVYGVAFSPCKPDLLASCSDDGTVRVWNVKTGRCQLVLEGHSGSVRGVVFSPHDRNLLASCSSDKTVRIWKLFGAGVEKPPFEKKKDKRDKLCDVRFTFNF